MLFFVCSCSKNLTQSETEDFTSLEEANEIFHFLSPINGETNVSLSSRIKITYYINYFNDCDESDNEEMCEKMYGKKVFENIFEDLTIQKEGVNIPYFYQVEPSDDTSGEEGLLVLTPDVNKLEIGKYELTVRNIKTNVTKKSFFYIGSKAYPKTIILNKTEDGKFEQVVVFFSEFVNVDEDSICFKNYCNTEPCKVCDQITLAGSNDVAFDEPIVKINKTIKTNDGLLISAPPLSDNADYQFVKEDSNFFYIDKFSNSEDVKNFYFWGSN